MATAKSHLVERVAERLLQSGALEESAAHLLGPDRTAPGDVGSPKRIGREAEPGADSSSASGQPSRSAPKSAAAIDLLERPAVADEAPSFLPTIM
jgi:hypothetical protein